jgi:hypothetical protein
MLYLVSVHPKKNRNLVSINNEIQLIMMSDNRIQFSN